MAKKAVKSKSAGKGGDVLKLKVTLLETRPLIWRRIEVPADYNFWDLHVAIQNAMGWTDSHLHAFRVMEPESGEEVQLGIPEDEGYGDPILSGWEFPLMTTFHASGDKVEYEYDFGDGWLHKIVLEGVHPSEAGARYPRCLAGARACPPEDCGGIGGYENLLQTLKKPETKECKEIKDWLGRPFDPEAFDPATVVFEDPHERWKEVFGSRGKL